jgi:haloalkane dehalogenase
VVLRTLTAEEMDHYREPFRKAGEERRPTLSWPRNIPIDCEPADVVAIVDDYAKWLSASDVPKLFMNADHGAIVRGRIREFVRTWPNQTEITVSGVHFVQEDSADTIGTAMADYPRVALPTSAANRAAPAAVTFRGTYCSAITA